MNRIKKRLRKFAERILSKFGGETGLLVIAVLFDRRFNREIRAVLSGKREFRRRFAGSDDLEYSLRRNIHRIEKGLIMRPRRREFGTAYIADTVELFSRFLRNQPQCAANSNGKWYLDVLTKYFQVAGRHPEIDAAAARFAALVRLAEPDPTHAPKMRSEYAPTRISYDEFFGLCRLRRSVRWYLDKPVPREIIDNAILAGVQSPSACNRQPFSFKVFDDPARVHEIASIPGGTVGFNHQFPAIAVVIGHLDAFENERDRHIIYIDGALASMAFMFALETQGVSSCAINWPDEEAREQKMDAALGLKPFERPVMLISLGYADPDGGVPHSQKKPLEEIRSYNS